MSIVYGAPRVGVVSARFAVSLRSLTALFDSGQFGLRMAGESFWKNFLLYSFHACIGQLQWRPSVVWVKRGESMKSSSAIGNRYPRTGERLAPFTLREVLLEKVPKRLTSGGPAAGLRLCDLDQQVWRWASEAVVNSLADRIIDRVSAGCAKRSFFRRQFPRPSAGMSLESLRLEHRTHLCLQREGLDADLGRLGDLTVGDVLSIRAFGPRCLVDLLCALETHLDDGVLCTELTTWAEQLVARANAQKVRDDDPRFESFMYQIDFESHTASQLARRLIDRTTDPPDCRFVCEQIRQLIQRVDSLPDRPLEQELIDIFASSGDRRNCDIVSAYYGWNDGQRHTLAEIGQRFGMTRERTRQICSKLVKRSKASTFLAPVLDRTLAIIERKLPTPVASLEQEIVSSGRTRVGLGLEQVRTAAELLDRPVRFSTVTLDRGDLAVRTEQESFPAAVSELAKKEAYYHGLATVSHLERTISRKSSGRVDRPIIVETLQMLDGFCWLDQRRSWFRLRSIRRHGLPKAIEKVLAVAKQVTASELRAAIGRNQRLWRVPPPEGVLLEFCRQSNGLVVDDRRIEARPALDWRKVLKGVERKLVEVLTEHGPVLERTALEELCVRAGMNRFSFHAFLASSPVITQHGHSVYGLLGSSVSPRAVRALLAKRRDQQAPTRVLDRHGETDDGKVWLRYRLSKAASTYAVVTVPAALKHRIVGKYRLTTHDGQQVGTLAAKDGRAWGLGSFLRKCQARIGDCIEITLDTSDRTALIVMVGSGQSPDGKPH